MPFNVYAMVSTIITFRDPNSDILNKPSAKIGVFDAELKKVARDMEEILLNLADAGLGLAAPQIGISRAIFAIRFGREVKFYCNPVIKDLSSEQEIMEEGCLSFPEIFFKIKRAKKVILVYQDLLGRNKTEKAEGILARAFQHETDHLNGITFDQKAR